MASELDKQRKKLREISYTLDQQHQLLRLIIQVRRSFNNKLSLLRYVQQHSK